MYTVSSLPSWHCWPKVQMKVCRAEPLCQRAKIEKGRLGAKSQTAQARHSKWLNYNNVWTECTPFCIDWTAWFFSFYNVYTSVRWPTLYLDSQSATKIQQQDQYNLYCSTTNTINTTSNTTNPAWLILACKSLCSPLHLDQLTSVSFREQTSTEHRVRIVTPCTSKTISWLKEGSGHSCPINLGR